MAQPAKSDGRRPRAWLALAAAVVVAALPVAGDVAEAQGRGRDRERGNERREQNWDRGGRGNGRWEARDGPARGDPRMPPGQARRDQERGEERRRYEDRRDQERRYDDRRRYAPQYAPPPGTYIAPPRGVRPGGYMPPGARAAPVTDYGRYRLRPPPAGYNWVRMGNAFVLMSRDGQIFDVIQD